MKHFRSDLSGKSYPQAERVAASTVRASVLAVIQREHPDFRPDQYLALSELNTYREKYISEYLEKQIGELSELDKTVLNAVSERKILSEEESSDDQSSLTLGQRVADKVASFGGSWTFIISFALFLLLWIIANSWLLYSHAFDPYPFILLNLILSCLAAIQAPVIMMSQKRQEEKDRERGKQDYMINLKSELEVRMLHEKVDHLIARQQEDLLEVQRIQVQMLKDIQKHLK